MPGTKLFGRSALWRAGERCRQAGPLSFALSGTILDASTFIRRSWSAHCESSIDGVTMMTGITPSNPPRHWPASESEFKDKPPPDSEQKIGMRRILGLAAAGLMLGFSFNTALADDMLSQSELRQLFPGSFDAVVYGLLEIRIIAQGNGQLIGLFSGRKDTGRWSVSNGRLCIMLNRWTDGKSSCSEVVVSNGWYRGNGVRFKKL